VQAVPLSNDEDENYRLHQLHRTITPPWTDFSLQCIQMR